MILKRDILYPAFFIERNTYDKGKFLQELEHKLGLLIKTIQVDKSYEFVNDKDVTNEKYFEETATTKGYIVKRIRLYSLIPI